jgi:hypothetical protein
MLGFRVLGFVGCIAIHLFGMVTAGINDMNDKCCYFLHCVRRLIGVV